MGVSLKATVVNFSDENPADAFFFTHVWKESTL